MAYRRTNGRRHLVIKKFSPAVRQAGVAQTLRLGRVKPTLILDDDDGLVEGTSDHSASSMVF